MPQDFSDEPDMPLHEFVTRAWSHIGEPEAFIDNWHLHAICEHLEAVSRGEIRDLILNLPPRTGKSSLISVIWPAWHWTWQPKLRMLMSSYDAKLSYRDSLRMRRLLETLWYKSNWGERFEVLTDKDTVQRYENNRGGYRIATSVGGLSTGEGAQLVLVDDPLKGDKGESELVREFANMWWSETMSTRRNDLRTAMRVVVMQRLHERDLTGYILAETPGEWTQLVLPMEYDPDTVRTTAIGYRDPRTVDGDLLWPEKFPADELEKLRAEMGEYGYAAQYNMRPAPRGGGLLKRAWFDIVPAAPVHAVKVRYWDKAASTDKRAARTAGVLMSRDVRTGMFYIEHITKGRWEVPERDAEMKRIAAMDGKRIPVWTEMEPGSGGKESAQNTIRMLPGWAVHADRVTGDKRLRAEALASQASIGMVKVVRGEWNDEFLAEVETFPNTRFKDQVDACSGAIAKLAVRRVGRPVAGPPRELIAIR